MMNITSIAALVSVFLVVVTANNALVLVKINAHHVYLLIYWLMEPPVPLLYAQVEDMLIL